MSEQTIKDLKTIQRDLKYLNETLVGLIKNLSASTNKEKTN